jgi:hypothetical protein
MNSLIARRIITVSPTVHSHVRGRRNFGVSVGRWAGRVNRDVKGRTSAAMVGSSSFLVRANRSRPRASRENDYRIAWPFFETQAAEQTTSNTSTQG